MVPMARITQVLRFMIISSILSSAYSSSITASASRRTRASDNHSYTTHADPSVPCDGRTTVPSNRRACGFFIWDLPSALLYRWCQYLLKDRIYEGRGGYLFVRYESNSILQLLYPCSRYSPNKCMICGGSYPDHLELWWSKHLYSPFDQYLDKTYNDALAIHEDDAKQQHRHRRTSEHYARNGIYRNRVDRNRRMSLKNPSPSSSIQSLPDPPTFGFHKRYVEDISDIIRKVKDLPANEQVKLIKKNMKKMSTLHSNRNYDACTVRGTGVTYVMPGIGGFTDKKSYTRRDAFIDILTIMARANVDGTIYRQAKEFKEKKRENSMVSNRLGQQ
mmetsp:Transcript_112/g.298  ORF Transcript_112/g.298 Transcript_112/m.298 type:complete len:332 (-) Transcript_112:52-1047(-)